MNIRYDYSDNVIRELPDPPSNRRICEMDASVWTHLVENTVVAEAALYKCNGFVCGTCACKKSKLTSCPICGAGVDTNLVNYYHTCMCGARLAVCNGYVRGYAVDTTATQEDII